MKTIKNCSYFALALFAFVCLGFLPQARAACEDACLQNNSTVHGISALTSNTSGYGNTANGAYALQRNTTGDYNTATGNTALYDNTTGHSNTATGSSTLVYNR